MTQAALRSTARAPGINTYSFIWSAPADQALRLLMEKGYRELELMLQPPHLELECSGPVHDAIKGMIQSGEITVHSLNMPSLDTNLASPFVEMRNHSVAMFRRTIDLAHSLGVKNVITVPGRMSPLSPAEMPLRRIWMRETLSALIPYAADKGVTLAVENIPMASFPRAQDILDFLIEMDSPTLGVCYDVANAHFYGEDPVEGLRLLADRLSIVHFSDTTRQHWRHDPIGAGDVDFGRICTALDEIEYTGPLLLEIIGANPLTAVEASHRALSAYGFAFNGKN